MLGNVLSFGEGVKIVDFGFVCLLCDFFEGFNQSVDVMLYYCFLEYVGFVFGVLLDVKSDQFVFVVIVYQMILGWLLFKGVFIVGSFEVCFFKLLCLLVSCEVGVLVDL